MRLCVARAAQGILCFSRFVCPQPSFGELLLGALPLCCGKANPFAVCITRQF